MLASDTGMCAGGVMIGSMAKIVRRSDGDMAGGAGDAAYVTKFHKWFLDGEHGDPPEAVAEENAFDRGVIFRRTGTIEVFERRGSFSCRAPYYAFGSGKESALGAMFAGANAAEAVRAAIEHDPHTAGEVLTLRAEVQEPA